MGGWLGAETQVSEDRPGERTGVGCTETARGSQCVVQESGTPDRECVQQSPIPPPKPHSQHTPKGRGGPTTAAPFSWLVHRGCGSASTSSESSQAQADCP